MRMVSKVSGRTIIKSLGVTLTVFGCVVVFDRPLHLHDVSGGFLCISLFASPLFGTPGLVRCNGVCR